MEREWSSWVGDILHADLQIDCISVKVAITSALLTPDVSPKVTSVMVYFLSVALAVSCLIVFALVFSMYKLNKKLCSVCNGKVFTNCKLVPHWPGLTLKMFLICRICFSSDIWHHGRSTSCVVKIIIKTNHQFKWLLIILQCYISHKNNLLLTEWGCRRSPLCCSEPEEKERTASTWQQHGDWVYLLQSKE